MATMFTGILQNMYDCSTRMVLTSNAIFMLRVKSFQTILVYVYGSILSKIIRLKICSHNYFKMYAIIHKYLYISRKFQQEAICKCIV